MERLILSRLETIERKIDNLAERACRLEYHFEGDCDVISRLDTLENQVVGSAVDKAVFDTKLSAHRQEHAHLIGDLQTEIYQVNKDLEESKTAAALSMRDYSGTTEGAICDIRGEISTMLEKFSSLGVSPPPEENVHENDSDFDEAWGEETESAVGTASEGPKPSAVATAEVPIDPVE